MLAEESAADDAEAAAALTQLTTAALALNLPLDNRTAAAMERLANGDRSVEAEIEGSALVPAIVAALAALGRKALQEALKRLPGLWRWLRRRKEKDGGKDKDSQPPAPGPLLQKPTLGRPADTSDEEGTDSGQQGGSRSEPSLTDEGRATGAGNAEDPETQEVPPDRPDWLSLDPKRLRREIEDEKIHGIGAVSRRKAEQCSTISLPKTIGSATKTIRPSVIRIRHCQLKALGEP